MNAVVDAEDLAQQEIEDLATIRAEIEAAKAELEQIRALQAAQPESPAAGKQMTAARQELEKELKALNLERARHLKNQVDWARLKRTGMPPTFLSPISNREDGSAPPNNPDGSSVVPDGMLPVWVSCYDNQGRDASEPAQVRMRRQEGYEIAKYADGREVRDGSLGVLMYATPRKAAEWTARRMPAGAVNPSDYFAAEVEQYAELENAQAGGRVLRVRREEDHGQWTETSLYQP